MHFAPEIGSFALGSHLNFTPELVLRLARTVPTIQTNLLFAVAPISRLMLNIRIIWPYMAHQRHTLKGKRIVLKGRLSINSARKTHFDWRCKYLGNIILPVRGMMHACGTGRDSPPFDYQYKGAKRFRAPFRVTISDDVLPLTNGGLPSTKVSIVYPLLTPTFVGATRRVVGVRKY